MKSRLIQGALAGLTATLPMSAAMELGADQLPRREQYPLPPRLITSRVADKAGYQHRLSDSEIKAATLAAHFGYGATMGAIYSAVVPPKWVGAKSGVLFGLGVWAGSYLGLLPALGILKLATEHPARRNALMIGAHVVWGSTLGRTLQSMADTEDDS
jgi:uncharacterized membrane protein YagU involved in acid resistance